jgi:hypothetical protein
MFKFMFFIYFLKRLITAHPYLNKNVEGWTKKIFLTKIIFTFRHLSLKYMFKSSSDISGPEIIISKIHPVKFLYI